ncbi:MAG: proprotein convertase P-domain-containing protein, partial [Flavobacteriales bacterium]|nr:proprotein convertase P-domain-containing protein [Flavobacteriales bacterium]
MKILSTILFIALSHVIYAQIDVLISDDDYTTTGQGLCDCGTSFSYVDSLNFHDTGGDASDYLPNEDEVITFCPDVNGNKVSTTFGIGGTGFTFDVDPSDTIFIYDGVSIFDPLLDTFNNNMMPVGSVRASLANLSGCLTIRFISDGANEGTGWDANVSCGNFSQPYSVGIEGFINGTANGANDNINDVMPVDTGYIDVCLGDSVLLSADTYFPYEPGGDSASTFGGGYDQTGNHSVEWVISNGVTSTQNSLWVVPPAQQGYFVSLKVTDAFGMNMYATCKIRVSTTPSFATCIAEDTLLCVDQQTLLIGGVNATDTAGVDATTATFPIGGEFGTATFLPDGNGSIYQAEIDIAGYTVGGTILNGTDIQQICVSIEHTWLGDLEMWLTCPNGTDVTIFNSNTGGFIPGGFSGGGTYVGGGDDNTSNQGNCEEYCFSEANGALPSWNLGYNTIASSGPTAGQMVVPGEYNPEGAFADFVGCPINGTWTLNVSDNI